MYDVLPKVSPLISIIADKSLDYKFKVRGLQKPKNKIVIVTGDEKAFSAFGQWPFDRGTVFAPLIENICKLGPKAVGFDIVWSEYEKLISGGVKSALESTLGSRKSELDQILKNSNGDTLLRKAIESCHEKIVLGYSLSSVEPDGPTDEFDKRLKALLNEPHNRMSGAAMGKIVYNSKNNDVEDANVDFYHVGKSGLLNIPSITPPHVSQGFFNNEEDLDGNYRRAFFFYRVGDSFVPSLTLRMAQKYLSPGDVPASVFISSDLPNGTPRQLRLELDTPTGKRHLPIDLIGHSIVNYRGPNNAFPNISMADLANTNDTVEYDLVEPTGVKHYKILKSELFKDAMVIVGITATGLYDIRPRPFDPQASGVENHATVLDNLLSDDLLYRPTNEIIFAMLGAVLVVGLLFGWIISRLDSKLGALVAVSAIGGLLYFDQVYLFNKNGIVIFSHLYAFQLLLEYLGITVLKYGQEESEKKFIRSAFGKYVSPDVVNQMINDPSMLKIGGDKKELSILFSDIRGFTELSERVDVKALAQFLNEYLGAMTDILQANSGTLDKYIGDAVMGFWGAPLDNSSHARLAVKTAVEMVGKLEELNRSFEQKYGLKIDIGIGINTGPVTVGNFGSSKVFSYTVIGDNVNLASRLEGINKYYGTHIIISETTYAQLKPGEFLTREVDTVKVKGKHKPVKIYEVFPDNSAHQPLKNVLKTFNEGLTHYYARKWDKALLFFQTVLQGRDGDRPSLELIDRCKYYINNPPGDDWDGSWEMHSK